MASYTFYYCDDLSAERTACLATQTIEVFGDKTDLDTLLTEVKRTFEELKESGVMICRLLMRTDDERLYEPYRARVQQTIGAFSLMQMSDALKTIRKWFWARSGAFER